MGIRLFEYGLRECVLETFGFVSFLTLERILVVSVGLYLRCMHWSSSWVSALGVCVGFPLGCLRWASSWVMYRAMRRQCTRDA